MVNVSGWCSAPAGFRPQHERCRMSPSCECECHEGRKSPNQAQQSGSERFERVESGAERRSPSRVLGGPQPGLLPPHHSITPRSEG